VSPCLRRDEETTRLDVHRSHRHRCLDHCIAIRGLQGKPGGNPPSSPTGPCSGERERAGVERRASSILIAWVVSRRAGIQVITALRWNDPPSSDGGDWGKSGSDWRRAETKHILAISIYRCVPLSRFSSCSDSRSSIPRGSFDPPLHFADFRSIRCCRACPAVACRLACSSACRLVFFTACLLVCSSACLIVCFRLVVRLSGCLVVWLSGCLVVWLSGCLVVSLSGCLVVWLYGCTVVRSTQSLISPQKHVPRFRNRRRGVHGVCDLRRLHRAEACAWAWGGAPLSGGERGERRRGGGW
jgi:hypothetical protein